MSSSSVKAIAAIPIISVALLTGCQQESGEGSFGPKTGIGAALGAAGGGLIGAAAGGGAAGIVGGVLIGGLAGGAIGSALDAQDRDTANRSTAQALESTPSGTTTAWRNPDSGNSGTVTPTRTFQNPDGTYCREYQQTVVISGETTQTYGTACRQPDGTWKVVN